jgi:hypothetical protein
MAHSPGGFGSASPSLQTTIPHVPLGGDARHKCDCYQLALDDRNDSFEKHFTEQMKEYGQSKGYKSVAAILLSWEGTDLQNTDDEVGTARVSRVLLTVADR